jgi:hypothetical protein
MKDKVYKAIEKHVSGELGVDCIYPILFTDKFGIDRKIAAIAHVIGVKKDDFDGLIPKRTTGEGFNARSAVQIIVDLTRKARGIEVTDNKENTEEKKEKSSEIKEDDGIDEIKEDDDTDIDKPEEDPSPDQEKSEKE